MSFRRIIPYMPANKKIGLVRPDRPADGVIGFA